MVSGFISRLVILIFGTLYPAYASYKAVRTKNVKEYVKWMMYWIVFALFTCAETFTDLFLGFWFPFYYEIKIITVIYLLSPATKGSSILYRKFVHPVLTKREQEIDEYIAKMKEQGYHTMINLGSKGVNYATSLIMQTAIRSGGGLVNQLKKSYSLNDLSDGQNSRKTESGDNVDSSYNEESSLIRRNTVENRHSVAPSTGQSGLNLSEAIIYSPRYSQLQDGEGYRQISAYEKMDPGYSTGEPCYYGLQQPVGPPLVRTSSLGPSSRIRTRASTKHVLPKRSSLSEGGSTWSAMEPRESQNETENYFNFPLSHSASFPLAFYPFQHLVSPEYQNLFGNFTQNQMFTFINSLQPVQSSKPLDEGSSNEVFVNPSETISEEISINSSEVAENIAVDFEAKNKVGEANVISKEGTEKTLGENEIREDKKKEEIMNENDEESVNPIKSLQLKDNSIHERSGRYNKKPAPTPPAEESSVAYLSVDEDEAPFFTPNASPKPSRKCSPSTDVSADKVCAEYDNRDKFDGGNVSHVPKKNKSKMKKTDFNIQKKLHMPFQFSFWHPKERKQFSAAETPSVANVDISTNADSKKEYFIPLRDESKTDGSTDGRDQDS